MEIGRIVVDADLSPRSGINQGKVMEYAEILDEMPPVTVF